METPLSLAVIRSAVSRRGGGGNFAAGLYCTIWGHRCREARYRGWDILEWNPSGLDESVEKGKSSVLQKCLGWSHFHIFLFLNSLINSGIITVAQSSLHSGVPPSKSLPCLCHSPFSSTWGLLDLGKCSHRTRDAWESTVINETH